MQGFIILATVVLFREMRHHNRPLRVVGATKTDEGHIRVDIENRGKTPFFVKPSVRVKHTPSKQMQKDLGEIPMLPATNSDTRKVYDLLGEASSPYMINASETGQIIIDCEKLEEGVDRQGMVVALEYGLSQDELAKHMSYDVSLTEPVEHPYLRHVGEGRAFLLKSDHHKILGESCMLEGLLEALESASSESIEFHLREGNDFASWVGKVVGDKKLAEKLGEVTLTEPEKTRSELAELVRGRIMDLERLEFRGSHPNLGHVGDSYAFKLCLDKDHIIGEASFLHELSDSIRNSPAESVVYHLGDGGNDFAEWALDVLGDEKLADDLRSVELISPLKTRQHLADVIDARIKELS